MITQGKEYEIQTTDREAIIKILMKITDCHILKQVIKSDETKEGFNLTLHMENKEIGYLYFRTVHYNKIDGLYTYEGVIETDPISTKVPNTLVKGK